MRPSKLKNVDAVRFDRALEHELLVEPEDVVPHHDVGILLLDQLGPRQQHVAFGGAVHGHDVFDGVSLAHVDAVVQVGFGRPVANEGRPDVGDLVAFEFREELTQTLSEDGDLEKLVERLVQYQGHDGFTLRKIQGVRRLFKVVFLFDTFI